jgi:hypothetical protein
MKRLPIRQQNAEKSSIMANIAGTKISDSTVEKIKPPITASAMGERISPPAPKLKALGTMPATMAMSS